MTNDRKPILSQCQTIGSPAPKTWEDYRQGCLATYSGGHRTPEMIEAFRHGMETVCNLLQAEFPPPAMCHAAPDLLDAAQKALGALGNEQFPDPKNLTEDEVARFDAVLHLVSAIKEATGVMP